MEEIQRPEKCIAKECGKKNTISTCITNKTKTMEAFESCQINSGRQRFNMSDNRDLDEVVFIWFKNVRLNNTLVNGVIKEKALRLVQNFNLTDFRASYKSLDKWKQKD